MKKHLVSLICLFLALILACPAVLAEAGGTAAYAVEKRAYPYLYCYQENTEPVTSEMNLYFINGGDVPYVALTEFIPVLTEMFNTRLKCDEDSQVSFELQVSGQPDGNSVFIVRRPDNESTWIIQPGDDTMTFTNYNSFGHRPGAGALVSVTELPDLKQTFAFSEIVLELMYASRNGEDTTELQMKAAAGLSAAEDPAAEHTLFVSSNKIYNRNGKPLTMDLGKYQIDIINEGDECYLPLQTMSDVFFSPQYIYYVFNDEKIIADVHKGTLMDQAYDVKPADMSVEFALFNFRELCFLMDYFYGLKAEHRIDNFSDFLSLDAGAFAKLTSTDSIAFDAALTEILLRFFDDGHSAIVRNSWRSGLEKGIEYISMFANMGYSTMTRSSAEMKLDIIRRTVYPDGVPGYEEIGDTAFVTFDSFTVNRKPEEYYELENPDDPQDTVELMIYANRMVRREGSPVKNIVIDLSLNGGGNSDAAIAVASWFVGETRFSLLDTMTGAETIACYRTDLNLNGIALSNPEGGPGTFDPGDTVSGSQYNLYCLISPSSFSCANLVPAIFEQAGGITLIGQRTGGGSNVVFPATTASGMIFQMSGPSQVTSYSNGSLYGVDTGVEPHVRLNKYESFYDREALVEMIHNLK